MNKWGWSDRAAPKSKKSYVGGIAGAGILLIAARG